MKQRYIGYQDLGFESPRSPYKPCPKSSLPTPWDNLIISVRWAHTWLGLRHNYPWLRTVVLQKVGRQWFGVYLSLWKSHLYPKTYDPASAGLQDPVFFCSAWKEWKFSLNRKVSLPIQPEVGVLILTQVRFFRTSWLLISEHLNIRDELIVISSGHVPTEGMNSLKVWISIHA